MGLSMVLLLTFWSLLFIPQSDSKIRIIHADYNLGKKINGEQLRILKGSVHVVKDTTNMFCDSAYYYDSRNILELFGKVKVINGKRTIRSKKMIYFPDDNIVECLGNVKVTSAKDSIFTQKLIYNLEKKEASATREVFIWSKDENTVITGDNGYFNNQTSYFRVTQNSHFIQIDTTTLDTFQVWAKKLEYFGDPLNHSLATGGVIMKQDNFTAHCDSSWFFVDTEKSLLKGNPKIWFDKSELMGDVVHATFDSTSLKYIYIVGNAVAKTLNDTSKSEYNILTGKTIEFFIENKQPQIIVARSNASSVYYLENETETGSNYSTSDSIFVYFKVGELDSINIVGGAQGTYYPDSYKGEKTFDQ